MSQIKYDIGDPVVLMNQNGEFRTFGTVLEKLHSFYGHYLIELTEPVQNKDGMMIFVIAVSPTGMKLNQDLIDSFKIDDES